MFHQNFELDMPKTELFISSPYFIFFIVSLLMMKCVLGQSIQKTGLVPLWLSLSHQWVTKSTDSSMLTCQHHLPPPYHQDSCGILIIWSHAERLFPSFLRTDFHPCFQRPNLPVIILKLLYFCGTDLWLIVAHVPWTLPGYTPPFPQLCQHLYFTVAFSNFSGSHC